MELWFYCHAVFYKEFPESLQKVEGLLGQGAQSIGWYLGDVLQTAKSLGHPNYKKLCELERRITAG